MALALRRPHADKIGFALTGRQAEPDHSHKVDPGGLADELDCPCRPWDMPDIA
jgi:hypothetical protein